MEHFCEALLHFGHPELVGLRAFCYRQRTDAVLGNLHGSRTLPARSTATAILMGSSHPKDRLQGYLGLGTDQRD